MTLKVGSLFAGVGGLDLALEQVLDAEPEWLSEIDPAASKVLAHHYPEVPNLGDVTQIDWAGVPRVDILTAGFPCQDVSIVGARRGMGEGTRTGLWSHVVTAIQALNPQLVVLENVRGLLSAKASRSLEPEAPDVGNLRALGAVLGDLAGLGFDAEWGVLPASAIGAPHKRERVFVVAAPADSRGSAIWQHSRESLAEEARSQEGDGSRDHRGVWPAGDGGRVEAGELTLLPTPVARDGKGKPSPGYSNGSLPREADGYGTEEWGKYEDAIRRWETVLGRPAPSPLEKGTRGKMRLSTRFSEWMMGWPEGWVTDPAFGLGQHDRCRLIGNGVMPQQGAEAISQLLLRLERS